MKQWAIALERVTQESAAQGECAGSEYYDRLAFREAVEWFLEAGREHGVEADGYPVSVKAPPRWVTAYGGYDYQDGSYSNVSLFIPDYVTPSSRLRLARLLGVRVALH